MKKRITCNPIRSVGCVTGENSFRLFSHFMLLGWIAPVSLTWNISFTNADIETKMDLVMANKLDI